MFAMHMFAIQGLLTHHSLFTYVVMATQLYHRYEVYLVVKKNFLKVYLFFNPRALILYKFLLLLYLTCALIPLRYIAHFMAWVTNTTVSVTSLHHIHPAFIQFIQHFFCSGT